MKIINNLFKESKKVKVIIAISGGVDSAVSAYLLKEEGYEVIGVFMRLSDNYSKSEDNARRACNYLGIKFYAINLADKFELEVIDYFIESYEKGITPNPCVKCNKVIKFGELFRVMHDLQADYLATGHYVRLQRTFKNKELGIENDVIKIFKGLDGEKDQTYFLYNLKQKQLGKILFPIGDMKKSNVRQIADNNKIPYMKSESQDICFLVENDKIIDHNDFLKKKINLKPGPVKTMDDEVIGEHIGLPFYTIGQRRGIDIGGTGPYYAAKMDYKTNSLYVVKDLNDKALLSGEFIIEDVNWINSKKDVKLECEAVIRYRFKPVVCILIKQKKKKEYLVQLSKPQRAVTPGQSVVFYNGDELLGGGIIK